MRPYEVLPLSLKMKLGVMATKKYVAFPKASEMTSHNQISFSVLSRTVSPICRDPVSYSVAPVD